MTERQKLILKALIESFIESGHDISSFELLRRSAFGVSSATLRNEFLELSHGGYLTKSHFASGRIPTIKALYFYVNNLMVEEAVAFVDVVKDGQALFNSRFEVQSLLREAMKTLYRWTGEPVFILYNDVIQFYRMSRLLNEYTNFPKKIQSDYLSGLMKFWDVIEDPELLSSFLRQKFEFPSEGVGIFSGAELGWKDLENFIAVFTPFRLFNGEQVGYVGTLGYVNLKYSTVVPGLKSMANILNNILRGW
jgi:transcriptional regulator of heat shock response